MKASPAAVAPLPEISVVIPVFDEGGSILQLLAETVAALRPVCRFELVVVDDGSSDDTFERLRAASCELRELVVLRHARNAGQSVALLTGVRHARGDWIATLDGDGQNDPADLPRLLALRADCGPSVGLLAGHRVARQDSAAKRWGSRLANAVRRNLLRDDTPDTGCGTKLFQREAFLQLPRFDHMHRFLPALFRRDGWSVVTVPVNHRPRRCGRSKYGNLQRLAVGLIDLAGVWWLLRRPVRCQVAPPVTVAQCAEQVAA